MKRVRRTFSSAFKAKVALEALKEIKTVSEIDQHYQVHPNQISGWKKEFLSNAGKVFDSGNEETEQINRLKKENESLVQQIGQLTVDNNWLKKKAAMIPLSIRKAMIDKDQGGVSICHQCELLDVARSTLYYTPSTRSDDDLMLMKELDMLHLEDPTRGTRRMAKELHKLGHSAGRYHVRTLMRIMRLKTVYCRPRTTIIDPARYKFSYLLRNLSINRPNQVWALDITYIPMPRGFMYLLAIMDVYSRMIVGWSLSNTMEAQWVVNTLKTAISNYGKPEIINSDQGSQFTSDEYVDYVKSLETVKISMDGKGRAIGNVFIERFFRTIKYDSIYLHHPETGNELHTVCTQFINYYNEKRDHSSIGDIPPIKAYRRVA